MSYRANPYGPRAVRMVKDLAAKPRTEPVVMATGEKSWVYLNLKGVLTHRWQLNLAADAMIHHVAKYKPTAIGGPTMGADMLAHVMVSRNWLNGDWGWFAVRSARKTTHGLGLWIEGATLSEGDQVVLMDDVANSGKSLVDAYMHVIDTGATVAAICPFVDRSGVAEKALRDAGITAPYEPLMYAEDLDIEPLIGAS